MGRREKLEGEKAGGGGGPASLKNDSCFMIVLWLEINGDFLRFFSNINPVSYAVTAYNVDVFKKT